MAKVKFRVMVNDWVSPVLAEAPDDQGMSNHQLVSAFLTLMVDAYHEFNETGTISNLTE